MSSTTGIEKTHFSVSNNTRWHRLRDVMLELEPVDRPKFRSRCFPHCYESPWDGEWYYHFWECGFEKVEWVELSGGALLDPKVFASIVHLNFVGRLTGETLRLFGYVEIGMQAEKLQNL